MLRQLGVLWRGQLRRGMAKHPTLFGRRPSLTSATAVDSPVKEVIGTVERGRIARAGRIW